MGKKKLFWAGKTKSPALAAAKAGKEKYDYCAVSAERLASAICSRR